MKSFICALFVCSFLWHLPLFMMELVPHDNSCVLDISDELETKEKKEIKAYTTQLNHITFPKEVKKTIINLAYQLYWLDEIKPFMPYCPIQIGNLTLSVIDIWKVPSRDRTVILDYRNKDFFTENDREKLAFILTKEQKQKAIIHRLPANDELYRDWCGISGGRCVLRFCISPTIAGGMAGFTAMGLILSHYTTLVIAGASLGVGGIICVIGSAIAYYKHRKNVRSHPVAMVFNEQA